MEDLGHTLTKTMIALRRFSEKMDNPQVTKLINPFLEKTNADSIEYGSISSGDKLTNIFILNFTDGAKAVLATGNFWQSREEDYTIVYLLESDNLYRAEQSGNLERNDSKKWQDLYSYLQKNVKNLKAIKNSDDSEDGVKALSIDLSDAAIKIF
jgi:hypothetical protein